MYLPPPSLLAALVSALHPLTLALPTTRALSSYALLARAVHCDNAPNTRAGTLLTRDPSAPHFNLALFPSDGLSLPPRAPTTPLIWCTPGSTTYLALTATPHPISASTPAASTFPLLLHNAYLQAQTRMKLGQGDAPSPGLYATQSGAALEVRPLRPGGTMAGKPLTWTVVGEAVRALADEMRVKGEVACSFSVFSGASMVGTGSVRI